ncbi:MAG: penicillin-binding protein activator [Pseudomonadota bacterium]
MASGLHIQRPAGKVIAMIQRFSCLAFLCVLAAACTQPAPSGPRVAMPNAAPTLDNAQNREQNAQDDIRIAAVLPLSGPEARLGDAMAKAIELAFFQAADPRIALQFFDSAGSNAALESRAFLVQTVEDFAPTAVIGPLFSDTAQALAPVMLERGVPVLSFSNDMAANAAGAILLGQQPEQEVARVLAHVAGALETRRIGMILPDDIYGSRVSIAADATLRALNALEEERYEARKLAFAQHSRSRVFASLVPGQPSVFPEPTYETAPIEGNIAFGTEQRDAEEDTLEPIKLFNVTVSERYPRSLRELDIPARRVAQFYKREAEVAAEREFLTQLDDPMGLDYLDYIRNIDTFGQPAYDAILIAEGGQILRALAPLLNVYSVDEEEIQFLGTGLWNDPGLSREPALHGGLFATAAPAAGPQFAQRYLNSYSESPPPLAAAAYDAMSILAMAARDRTGAPSVFNPARLFAERGYNGASGLLRILPSGITERTLAIMKITESGLMTVDQAPTRFAPYERPGAQEPLQEQTIASDPVSR